MDREKLEAQLAQLPLCQYEFISTSELEFSENVRYICRTECPMYGKTWACPPGVGTVSACREKCLSYPKAFMFTTMAEVSDIESMEETLSTRAQHEEITHQVADIFRQQHADIYVLSAQACHYCKQCSYPDAPCRRPDKMFPCVESHGVLVTALAEKYGISFINGYNVVTWFSLLLYR